MFAVARSPPRPKGQQLTHACMQKQLARSHVGDGSPKIEISKRRLHCNGDLRATICNVFPPSRAVRWHRDGPSSVENKGIHMQQRLTNRANFRDRLATPFALVA